MIDLHWMRADAPYMPIATAGLLALLEDAGVPARARWSDTLLIETEASLDDVSVAIASASLPEVDAIDWPSPGQQALKSSLASADNALAAYSGLVVDASEVERRLLVALVTDQAIDDGRVPVRSRLLRGVKSDLSAFRDVPPQEAARLLTELEDGPRFGAGKSGRALGLVPEVQTFGGTVGRNASTVDAESPLLSLLLRHGLLALPPVGVHRASRRVAGGPLIDDDGRLSWPRWTISCGLGELRVLFSLADLHTRDPDIGTLRQRGVTAVYRSAAEQLSTTVAVFRWGARVA